MNRYGGFLQKSFSYVVDTDDLGPNPSQYDIMRYMSSQITDRSLLVRDVKREILSLISMFIDIRKIRNIYESDDDQDFYP